MERVYELKKNLDDQDYMLKKQYIKLMKEKAIYAAKLNDIYAIGSNLEWEQRSRVLQKIKPLIDAGKNKLRADTKTITNESRV